MKHPSCLIADNHVRRREGTEVFYALFKIHGIWYTGWGWALKENMTPSVFTYTNYRAWLGAVFDHKKTSKGGFSYRLFSFRAGFSSPNFIRMVVMGSRNLSIEGIEKLSRYLELSEGEAKFFRHLVGFNQAVGIDEKNRHFEELCFFKAFQEIKRLDQRNYTYFSKWYYPAIREMAYCDGFRADPAWVSERLDGRVSREQAGEALRLLKEWGFIVPNEQGRFHPAQPALSTDDEVTNISLLNFHREMIGQAGHALGNTPAPFRDVSSITIAMDYKTFDKTKKRLQELRRELLVAMSKTKSPDTVCQLNLQLFNLSAIPNDWYKQANVARKKARELP
jgi:uncharacterized protein (TIGR02147 family)